MKNYKKGLTVTSIVVYVVLFFMFTSITTMISSRFNKNLFNDRGMAINTTALNKLQYNLLASANDSYNVKGNVEGNKTTLTFSNSDEYVFDLDKNTVYKNGGKLVNYVKAFDVRLLDDIIDIDITVNKYTNELAKNIKISIHTEDYIDNGLIAHYDGLNNTGEKEHSNDASTWKDLSSNAVTATLSDKFTHDGTTNGWLENGILIPKVVSGGVGTYNVTSVFPTLYSLPKTTIEIILNVQEVYLHASDYSDYVYYLITQNSAGTTTLRLAFRYGVTLAYNSMANGSASGAVFNYNSKHMNEFYNHTVTVIQSDLNTRTLYIDGKKINSVTNKQYTELNIKSMILRSYPHSAYITHSIRVYDRALTEEEIKHNYMIDRLRFGEK